MKYDIAFTLGRTQPPHKAHFKMLLDALLSLNENGKLIHFIGSTNIPLKFAQGEKNILSFEERRDMLTEGLIEELKARYAADPTSIPEKFAARIANRESSILTADDFECVALPDFTDANRQFTSNQDTSTIARPFEGIRTDAMNQVVSEKMAKTTPDGQIQLNANNANKVILSADFAQKLQDIITAQSEFHTDASQTILNEITQFGHPYMGWAINLRNELNKKVEEYSKRTGKSMPEVAYQCCDKDKGTLQYILLVAAVIEFVKHNYKFHLVLTPVEMLDEKNAVSATDIRNAYVAILMDPGASKEALLAAIREPAQLIEKYPILAHMHPQGRVVMLEAMIRLKEIADKPLEANAPVNANNASSASMHTSTVMAPTVSSASSSGANQDTQQAKRQKI